MKEVLPIHETPIYTLSGKQWCWNMQRGIAHRFFGKRCRMKCGRIFGACSYFLDGGAITESVLSDDIDILDVQGFQTKATIKRMISHIKISIGILFATLTNSQGCQPRTAIEGIFPNG
jgi:hypothetical protein